MSECLQIMRLEFKYDQNPSFIIRSRNKYDWNPIFCDVTTVLRDVCYGCYDQYTLIPWWIPLFFVCNFTDVTISLVCLNRRYERCALFEPKLRSVFLTSTDISIRDLDFNRWLVLSTYGPVTEVTINILISWPPFTF